MLYRFTCTCEKFRRAANPTILDEWLAARKRLRPPDMGNGWVGCDDGIGHAVERVFGKRGRPCTSVRVEAGEVC